MYHRWGENITISVENFLVDDLLSKEDKIKWAVQRLKDNYSIGPSGMRVEHLQQWLREVQNMESEETTAAKTGAGTATEADMKTVMAVETGMEATWPPDLPHLQRAVDLIQAAFREVRLEE